MSYAAIAKHGVSASDHGAIPSQEYLNNAGADAGPVVGQEESQLDGNVHVVDRAEFEKEREGLKHADEVSSSTTYEVEFVPPKPESQHPHKAQEQGSAARDVKQSAAASAKPVKEETRQAAASAEQKGKQVATEAKAKGSELRAEAKEFVSDVEDKSEELATKAKKEGRELADKAEKKGKELKADAEKEAKELKKKAAKADREVRDYARKHPQAITGLVGAVNVAILAGVGLALYSKWDRLSRQTVSLSVLGLAAVFGAEGALGFWEVQQNEKEMGRK